MRRSTRFQGRFTRGATLAVLPPWRCFCHGGASVRRLGRFGAPGRLGRLDRLGGAPPGGRLTARWWQWALALPLDEHPAVDAEGITCAEHQSGSLWYLVGVFDESGQARRECHVPRGVWPLVPAINVDCSDDDGVTWA